MYKKLIAVFMVLIMGLSALSSLAEAPAEDPVLATVNGKKITKSQVDAEIVQMLNNQFVDDETQYATVLQFMVNRELITKKIADLGFDQFTKEEEDAFLSEAQQQLDKAIETYADYYQSADSEKAREDAVAQARDSFAAQGVTDLIECGPGKVLSGLNKRCAKGVATHNLDSAAGLAAALAQFA